MKFPISTFSFLLVVLTTNAQHALVYKDTRFQYVLTIDSVISGDSVNYDCAVKSIKIFSLKDHKLIQVILPEENYPDCELPKDQRFIIEDMNFDGINDIRLVQFLPAAPNIPYYCWVYNSVTNRFVRNKALEEITSPTFDHKQKLIYSFWRTSCCDHGLSTYRYVNGRPMLIEETETAMDENDTSKYVTTEKKLVNGKWKKTRTVD